MGRRLIYALLAAVVLLLVVAQFALPSIASNRVTDKLTDGGGTATASVSALPAVQLLWGDGDKLTATGEGLNIDISGGDSQGFDRLDGFDDVSVHITDSQVGPFRIRDVALTRSSPAPYRLVGSATITPHDLVAFGADQLGFAAGFALRFGGAELLGGSAGSTIPIRFDMSLASQNGQVVVVAGGSTVDGFPTGPLGAAITSAIASSL
jgi:hypothetical protein